MKTNIRYVLYGAVIGHFIRHILDRVINGTEIPVPRSMFTAPKRREMTPEELRAETRDAAEPWEPPVA